MNTGVDGWHICQKTAVCVCVWWGGGAGGKLGFDDKKTL